MIDESFQYKIISFKIKSPYTLELIFNDGAIKEINFEKILSSEMFSPLKDQKLFNQVSIDPEVNTIVWPNRADFDPAILHDWDEF
ncbi:MAG: DUF2442 domain-containing protein [Ignavibacteria bacterium]|nr:DUF2442 domain-containing protein [Ignavibacteria bacterium]MBK8381011.1 DUF2442 domain-containing protein [Ignavibacteria bacterium]